VWKSSIVNTAVGTKMYLQHADRSINVYALCGTLPPLMSIYSDDNSLNDPFPNPSTDRITVPYSLPDNEKSGTLRILDINGNEIKSFKVDRTFDSIQLTTTDLPSGIYYCQLVTANGISGTKRIIKVE
jgi:hypothetical protein